MKMEELTSVTRELSSSRIAQGRIGAAKRNTLDAIAAGALPDLSLLPVETEPLTLGPP